VPPPGKPALWAFVWGRLVRDAGSDVLPFSQIGGFVLGARALTLARLPARMAAASMVVDVTMEMLSQLAYTGLALGVFAALRPQSGLAAPIAEGLAVAGVVGVLLVVAQRRGLPLMMRITDAVTRQWADFAAAGMAAVQGAIDEIYRHRGRLVAGSSLHLFTWIASAAEIWFALRLMGVPLDPGPVRAIEGGPATSRSACRPWSFGNSSRAGACGGGTRYRQWSSRPRPERRPPCCLSMEDRILGRREEARRSATGMLDIW
jgi:hypothetical protein